MTAQRIQDALERIDRALARIETQAALAHHAPVAPEAAGLAERHEALRASVTATLGELDGLIERLEA